MANSNYNEQYQFSLRRVMIWVTGFGVFLAVIRLGEVVVALICAWVAATLVEMCARVLRRSKLSGRSWLVFMTVLTTFFFLNFSGTVHPSTPMGKVVSIPYGWPFVAADIQFCVMGLIVYKEFNSIAIVYSFSIVVAYVAIDVGCRNRAWIHRRYSEQQRESASEG